MHGNAKEWCYDVYEKGFGTSALAHMSKEEREISYSDRPDRWIVRALQGGKRW